MNSKPKKRSTKQIFDDLERMANSIPTPLWWLDTNGINLGLNDATCITLGGLEVRDKIVGKSHEEYYPAHVAKKLNENNKKVIESGETVEFEEEVVNVKTGQTKYYTSIRSPLRDDDGIIIGIIGTSIDITDRKEKERLTLENEIQKVKLQEKEKLINVARKVAHDMGSPLSTLIIISKLCNEIHPEKRALLVSATRTIVDISNNLLSTYRRGENFHSGGSKTHIVEEPQQPLFLFDSITQLLSEKRVEYGGRPILLETDIEDDAQFTFALMQPVQLRRALSNLINNAVDALEDNPHGIVTVRLKADDHHVTIKVQDNGKGMSQTRINDLLQRHPFTADKENGHGLGWQQVWDTIDQNNGKIAIRSTPREGTTIDMAFPRIVAPSWIAQAIHIKKSDIIIILDDDESIQGAMALRFSSYLERDPTLRLHHFTQGQDVLDLLNRFTPKEKEHVMLLIDYDLFGQEKDGISIIEASRIQRTTLITGYYTNPDVQKRIKKLDIKVLPKHLAGTIPVYMNG